MSNRGPWATSGAQSVSVSDHAAMAAQVGTLPTPPAEVLPASTLAQALAWLIAMAGSVDDADRLDGQHGSYYTDASNLDAGTVPLARLATALAQIGALTPTSGGVPYYTAPGGPANLFTTSPWFRGSFAPLADAAAAKTLLGLAAIASSGSASALVSGTVPDNQLPGRLIGGWGRSQVSDANNALMAGAYYIDAGNAGALNAPFSDASANIDTKTLDSNGSNYSLQFATAIAKTSGIKNKIRYKIAGTFGAWVDAPISALEQAILWAPVSHTHSFSGITGSASASQITEVYTAGQHDNDTSPASTAYVLLQSGSFRQVVQSSGSDLDVEVSYSTHGGSLLKSVSKCVFWKIPAAGSNTASGQYPSGDAVVIQNERDYPIIVDFGLNGGSVHTSGGSFQQNLILPGGSGCFYYFVSYGSGNPWQMMSGAKAMAQAIDFPGGVAGEEQSPYYAFKLPDLHSSSHSTRIELSGAGCRSTASGYFGRSGAHIDSTITASYRPGYCLEFVVGSNSTGTTGSSTLALLPLSSYTITAPGGGSGNAVAPTYSSGLAPFLAAASTRPTSTASNSALDAGSQGGPMGGPGQKPDLRSGFGGGGAVFDGAGSGQYGAGAGVARLHYLSPYSRPKVIFALGCNAANGSTVFKDFGPSAATVTASGGVAHSTAQKYAGVNSIWLNGGYLSIGTPSIADFTAYSHVHIAMRWRYTRTSGALVLFDSRTTSGGGRGFCIFYDGSNGIIGVYERERVIASASASPASVLNKFNLIEVEIVPGVSRAFFRVWLNNSIVCYGFSEEIAAIEASDSLLIGKDVSIGTTLSDYIIGPCIMARL